MDIVNTFIYDNDIRIKATLLKNSLKELFKAQSMPKEKTPLFSKAALLAATFATEEKDDNGAIYVSIKDPNTKTALTAVCETDGRLRGCVDVYKDSSFSETILTVGRKLAIRGDYQSSVIGKDIEVAAEEYFKSSRQTKAKIKFFTFEDSDGFIFSEYFPGHNVNFQDENKKPTPEYLSKKLETALETAIEATIKNRSIDILKKVSTTKIIFGCTCSKRRIKQALSQTHDLTFPVEIKCRFCGKNYIIDSL